MNDLRTPLARARGLGSGKTGTEHFWVQRVTAIALALLVPWLLYLLISMVGHDAAHAIAPSVQRKVLSRCNATSVPRVCT